MRVVLVTGSRNHTNKKLIGKTLSEIAPDIVIHGGAVGADKIASEWVNNQPEVIEEEHPAQWKKFGRRAGPLRNERMLEVLKTYRVKGCECLVVGFPLAGSVGTLHMMAIAGSCDPPFIVNCFLDE